MSGTVSVPKGRAPKGGWPVISWGHGTTGIADACAPSRDSASNPAHGLIDYAYPLLQRWLKAGYAVVRTDYQGLGTPGAHPYRHRPRCDQRGADPARGSRGAHHPHAGADPAGESDATVFKLFTDPLVADYPAGAEDLSYKIYQGIDHGGVVRSARPAATRRATSAAACAEIARELVLEPTAGAYRLTRDRRP